LSAPAWSPSAANSTAQVVPTLAQAAAASSASPAAATQAATGVPADNSKKLEGSVTISIPDPFAACISDLIESAQSKDQQFATYQQAVDRYSTVGSKMGERTSDCLNYTLMYKGISPSSEAGDVVLGEKNKLKGIASAKYLRQKLHDELQLKVLNNVMQLAMTLGNGDEQDSSKEFRQGQEELVKLVGQQQADRTVALLKSMRDQQQQQAKQLPKQVWTISQTEKRIQAAVQAAATVDPIVKEIEDDVHHYNHHSSAALAGQRVVRVALSAVSLAPSVVGPAAQAVLFGFLVVSGGTEQEKVLRELYLDKRLSSRAHLLSEEAHLAFENYQLAAMTNNRLLMSCSEQLVSRMAGSASATKLLSGSDYVSPPTTQAQ